MPQRKIRGDVYVKTQNSGDSVRQMSFTRGRSGVIILDFNREREVVGVEVINAKEVRIDGKKV